MRNKWNKNKVWFCILILGMLTAIALSYYGMVNSGKTRKIHKVSVIVNDSGSERWIAMRQGIEQAADDCGIDINYVTTGNFQSFEEELAVIRREFDNGAEGVIVQFTAAGAEDDAVRFLAGSPVMLLESDIEPQEVCPLTAPDNYALGCALAEAFLAEGAALGERVGVLYEAAGEETEQNVPYPAMQDRLAGVRETLGGAGIETAWELALTPDAPPEEAAAQLAGLPADAVLALGNNAAEAAVDYLQGKDGEGKWALYGIGCSGKAVYYLDRGEIQSLVVPDEFKMGYQSVANMARRLQYPLSEMESSAVDYLVVDRDNLYDADRQKQLFPLVQ